MFNKQSNSILVSTVVSVGLFSTFAISDALANLSDVIDDPNELIRMGKTDASQSKHLDAIRCYSKAIKLSPVNHYAYFYRARSRKAMGDFQNAVEDYNYVIKLNPKSSKAYSERGWCLMKLDLPQRAMKDLNKAINLNNKNYRAYQYRSQIKYKLNDYQGALSDFNRVLKLKPNSSKDISKFLFPKINLVKKKKPKNAIAKKSDDTTISVSSKSGDFEKKDLAQVNNKAAKAIKSGKFEQAVKILEPITEKHPDYEFARRNLTIAYNNFGLKLARSNTKESVDKFRYALYFTPTEITARRNLNAVLSELGKKPKSHEARIAMGNELLTAGKLKLAFVEFTEALRLRNDPKVRRKLAEVCLELDNQKTTAEQSNPVEVARSKPKPTPTPKPDVNSSSNISSASSSSPKVAPAAPQVIERKVIASTDDDLNFLSLGQTVTDNQNVARNSSSTKQSSSTAQEKNNSGQIHFSLPVAKTSAQSRVNNNVNSPQIIKKPVVIEKAPLLASKTTPVSKVQKPKPVLSKLASLSLPPPAAPARPTMTSQTIKALQPKFSLTKEAILNAWSNHMSFGQQRFDEGDYLGAESSFDKAASLAEGLGGHSKELAMSLEKLAEVYIIHKKVSQAYSLLARALVILSKHHTVDDPRLVNLRDKLDKLSAVIDRNTSYSNGMESANLANGQ